MAVRDAERSTANADRGSALDTLVEAYNDLAGKYNALLAKMDSDDGVTDTDYAAEVGPADTVSLRP